MSSTQGPKIVPGGHPSTSESSSQEHAPIHFTAHLQHPLQAPSKTSTNKHQMLSLFRNPFYARNVPGGRYTPNIYNQLDANRVIYSRVRNEIMAILAELCAKSLADDFEAEFHCPEGLQRRTHLVLSGTLSDTGVISVEDCHLIKYWMQ